MNNNSKTLIILFIGSLMVLQSCKKETIERNTNMLIGSWSTTDYKHDNEEWEDHPGDNSPYIILNEYGSGFDLDNNKYYTHYSDSLPTMGIHRGNWRLLDNNTIEFTDITLKIHLVEIIELKEGFLWIHNNNVEYKMNKIE